MSEINLQIAAATHVGLVRKNNEDNLCVCASLDKQQWDLPEDTVTVDLGEAGSLLVVADGMGGANAGEVASAIAVDTVRQYLTPEVVAEAIATDTGVQDTLVSVVKTADKAIADEANANSEHSGMGTTIVMAWIVNGKAYICWCGDSRAYVFNPQASSSQQLSKDHSYVQQLIDAGKLDPANAHNHPYSNVITQCLGDQSHRAEPDVRMYHLIHGDTIMLCSDGLTGMCIDDDITDIIQQHQDEDLHETLNALIAAALDGGGHDNVTVALARYIETDIAKQDKVDNIDGDKEHNPLNDTVPIGGKVEKNNTTEEVTSNTVEVEKPKHNVRWTLLSLLLLCCIAAMLYWIFYPEQAQQTLDKVKQFVYAYLM